MAIPHSLDAVIEAVQALIDNRPIPDDWRAQPVQEPADFSQTLFDILHKASEATMNKEQFDALDKDAKVAALAERLAALRTKQKDTTPIEKALADLRGTLADINDRVSIIEAAILTSPGAGA